MFVTRRQETLLYNIAVAVGLTTLEPAQPRTHPRLQSMACQYGSAAIGRASSVVSSLDVLAQARLGVSRDCC